MNIRSISEKLCRLALMAGILSATPALAFTQQESPAAQMHGGTVALPEGRSAAKLRPNEDGVTVLEWQDLMPPKGEGRPVELDAGTAERKGAPTLEQFEEFSPEDFAYFLQDLGDMRAMQGQGAFVRTDLDGRKIRMPGYVTPVGFEDDEVTEFLLVPYLGACIHVPPPPANQIVYVDRVDGIAVEKMWEPVWVTGTLRARSIATILADVGYSLEDVEVEPYE